MDKHCGRLRWDFHQRFQEIAREFRQTWLAKIDDTTPSIRQALERAGSQKLTSAQSTQMRLTELDERLSKILESEANLLALRENVEASLQ